MSVMVSQITTLTIVYPSVYLGIDWRKHQSSASLAFVRGIHRWSLNSPHKGPVTRKMFPFDDVHLMMSSCYASLKFSQIVLTWPEYFVLPLSPDAVLSRSGWHYNHCHNTSLDEFTQGLVLLLVIYGTKEQVIFIKLTPGYVFKFSIYRNNSESRTGQESSTRD